MNSNGPMTNGSSSSYRWPVAARRGGSPAEMRRVEARSATCNHRVQSPADTSFRRDSRLPSGKFEIMNLRTLIMQLVLYTTAISTNIYRLSLLLPIELISRRRTLIDH